MKPFRKLKKFKILIGTPMNEVKNYCFDDFISRVSNLTYDNYDVLIADNSGSRKNMKRIMKAGINCIHIKPKLKANQAYITESHEALRLEALRGGYDFLLHLESDIIPPHDIIERLLIHQKQVTAATYFINEGHNSHLMIQEIEKSGDTVRHTVNIDSGFDILEVDGKLKKVYAEGLGCMLIHKTVLEKVKFRWENGADAHADSFFAADLNHLKIPIYLDSSLILEHRNSSWITNLDAYQLPK